MEDDTKITELRQPASIDDPLTEIAREGARRMLAAALQAEADAFVAELADERRPDGRQRVVKHGAGPEREIQTGIGTLVVRRPKVRDRAEGPAEGKVRFTSAILPRWARRSRSLDALLPVLYLRGISTGDVQEALSALLGENARNLSPGIRHGRSDPWRDIAHCRADRGMGGGLPTLAAPRPLSPSLRLRLGGWGLSPGAYGAAGRMHAGDDWGDTGGE